jgi:hypothetical protein
MAWRWGATGAAGALVVSSGAFALVWIALLLRLDKGLLARPAEPAVQ